MQDTLNLCPVNIFETVYRLKPFFNYALFFSNADILSVNSEFCFADNYGKELRSRKESEDLQLQSLQS